MFPFGLVAFCRILGRSVREFSWFRPTRATETKLKPAIEGIVSTHGLMLDNDFSSGYKALRGGETDVFGVSSVLFCAV